MANVKDPNHHVIFINLVNHLVNMRLTPVKRIPQFPLLSLVFVSDGAAVGKLGSLLDCFLQSVEPPRCRLRIGDVLFEIECFTIEQRAN